MRVWITKYALTTGIEEAEAKVCTSINDKMIEVVEDRRVGSIQRLFHKPYWHKSQEEAFKHAGKLRDAKIASLEKSITKLRSLRFGATP